MRACVFCFIVFRLCASEEDYLTYYRAFHEGSVKNYRDFEDDITGDYPDYGDYADDRDYPDYHLGDHPDYLGGDYPNSAQPLGEPGDYPDYSLPDKDDDADYAHVKESLPAKPAAAEPVTPVKCDEWIDLEQAPQEFILATKKIAIPGYPHAFNPSIIRWRGTLLLSFRIYHPVHRSAHQIGLVRLDDQLNLLERPHILRFRSEDPLFIRKRQDPRLISFSDKLFIVYNNVLDMRKKPEIRRMLMAEIHEDKQGFIAEDAEPFFHFEDESLRRSEKNWVAFETNGQLLFAYSIFPHRILEPLPCSGSCKTIASTFSPLRAKWNWGTVRGGTPALKVGDEYLAFFHSSKNLATVHSQGEIVQHYFMGAYTFSDTFPFGITRISSEPIVGKEFYRGAEYKTWKPMCVVFPGGFVCDDQVIWLAYGRQDHEVWIAKFDKKRLLDSLVTCGQP